MHEQYREQCPLLCDDLTDEENINSHYQRRYRPMTRGRARAQAKGAAAIISTWQDHWFSSVTNWWMALGMFAFTVFIVYNSVLAFALLPQVHTKPTRMKPNSKFTPIDINCEKYLPEVFFHTMIEAGEDIENKYAKYIALIDPITYKYPNFKYNLCVILNDRNSTSKNDYQNNEIALHSLWNKPIKRNNVMIHNVVLSHLMYKSPIMKDWQVLPNQFMDFLIRAVLIWEKGGIAISPQVLTSSVNYNEIVNSVLKTFANCNGTKIVKAVKKVNEKKQKKTVNNIQDIIDMLEHENEIDNNAPYSLTEAEDRNIITVTHNSRQLLSSEGNSNKSPQSANTNEAFHTEDNEVYSNTKLKLPKLSIPYKNNSISIIENEIDKSEYNETKLNLLPLFLQFLFHDKNKINLHKIDKENTTSNSRQRKSIAETDNVETSQITKSNETKSLKSAKNNYNLDIKPMIIPGKEINYDIIPKTETKDIKSSFNIDNLVIDVKGNILATRTPCHAFLGTMFQSVTHLINSTETLNIFLITELTHFCKGLLSSCRGIDVILI